MPYEHDGKMYHIGVAPGEVGKIVLLPGDPGRVPEIASRLDNARKVAENREFVTYTGTFHGIRISVTSTGIGGPSAAIAVEELVRCGADTFIRVGTCGGIDPEVVGGDAVIATASIRAEGTSREYAPIEFPAVADLAVTNALVAAAKSLGLRFHTGVTQSKDSFYGQHSPSEMPVASELSAKWEAWERMGAKASEMESAAIFIVSQFRRARAGAIFLTIANQTRARLGLPNPESHDIDKVIDTALLAAVALGTENV